MPRITEYTAPENIGLRPTETGVTATVAAARRVGGAYSEISEVKKEAGARIGSAISSLSGPIGEVIDWEYRKEQSQGSAALAGKLNEFTKKWHDINLNADPNDPTVAKGFQNYVEGELQKFKSGFLTQKGQDWAEQRIEAVRNHFFHQTTADRITAAGHAQTINADTAKQGYANSALWDGTENGTKVALDSWSKSPFNAKIIEAGKADIVSNGALGAIKKTGQVPEWVKTPEYRNYVDAAKLEQQAEHQRLQNEHIESVTRKQATYEQVQKYDSEVRKIYKESLPVNNESKPQLPPDYVERIRALDPGDGAPDKIQKKYTELVKHANTVIERLNRPEPLATVSHRNFMSLIDRIRSGEITNPGQIDDVARPSLGNPNGGLTTSDWNVARKEFFERETDQGLTLSKARGDFWKRTERSIDPGITAMGERTALGDEQIHKAQGAARQQEEALRAKGLDPHLVYDDRSEYYFGKPENLRNFSVSLQQANDYNAAIRRGETPKVPGAPPPPVTPPPTRPPVSRPEPTPAPTTLPRPTTAEERDALPKNTQYIAPDGSIRFR